MKAYKFTFLTIVFLICSSLAYTLEISRIEPPSWWSGMKNPNLQIMLYGKDLKDSKVEVKEAGIKVHSVENADSPDYLFINILVSPNLKPGKYKFTVSNQSQSREFEYEINRKGSGSSYTGSGFGPADMVYLIMPDRFINGDTSNDNHPEALEGVDISNKYGRYGGDIKGIINSLDYLKELGVTKIWSTPLLFDNEPVASYHGYACADYYRIDPRFGDNELFKKYVMEAGKRGIGVIMDMVPNHSGLSHWWMKNLPFNDWVHTFPQYTQSNYAMSTHHDIHASVYDNVKCTTGWFDTSMPDMNLNNKYLLTYFIQNAIWWVEWSGLSGIRVDTYPYSDKNAISEWTKAVMSEYPSMNIVGECWFSTPQEIAYWEGDARNRDGYSSNLTNVMDFPLQEAIGRSLNRDGNPGWGEGMFGIYRSISLDNIYSDPFKLMIFADNHDTNRISEVLKGNRDKFKMMLAIIATMRGIPQVYYGTEIMMMTPDGKLGHGEERMAMLRREQFNNEQMEMFEYVSQLFNWRKSSDAVIKGTMKHYWPNDNLYVYFRSYGDQKVMVVTNNNTKELELNWNIYKESVSFGERGINIINHNEVIAGDKFLVNPQSTFIIEFKK